MELPIRTFKWFMPPSDPILITAIEESKLLTPTERIQKITPFFQDLSLPLLTRFSSLKYIFMCNQISVFPEIQYMFTHLFNSSTYTNSQKFEILEELVSVTTPMMSQTMKSQFNYTVTKLYWLLWQKQLSLHHKKKCLRFFLTHKESFFWNTLIQELTNLVLLLPREELTEWVEILINCNHPELVEFGFSLLDNFQEEEKNKTLYEDPENVHDHSIQTCLQQILIQLEKDIVSEEKNIIHNIKHKFIHLQFPLTNKLEISFSRIQEDTTLFRTMTLLSLLNRIWHRIQKHTDDLQTQLLHRLYQELNDMADKCSSGHMARIISVLDGYDFHISISIISQLQANIKARIYSSIANMEDCDYRIELLNSVIGDKRDFRYYCEVYKIPLYQELKQEFVPTHLTEENFKNLFDALHKNEIN